MLLTPALHGARRRPRRWLLLLLPLAILNSSAGDWTQYRGPTHDGVSMDRIVKQWSGSVTNPAWLVPVTNGLGTFAVGGGRAVTQIRRTIDDVEKEVCVALDAGTGAEVWATTVDDALYPDGGVGYDDGPRSTPALDSDSVYVLGSYLNLYRLNAIDGAVVWHKDLRAIYGGDVISWQNAASPLIENGLIYLNANCGVNTLMALHAGDGSLAWRSRNEGLTHSTPILATIHGMRQVIFATQQGLVSLNPLTGGFLWRTNYPFNYAISLGASPVVYQNMVFISGAHAYAMGTVVLQVNFTNNAWSTTRLWYTNNPASHWMTPVVHEGFLYGQFGIQQFDSTPQTQLKCIDMRTGAVKWSTNNFGHGGTLLVDNHLVTITEKGDLVLSRPDTNAYVELGRFLAIPDYFGDTNKCWNSPAMADGRIYIRSTSFGACYDLSLPHLKLDAPSRVSGNNFELTVRTTTGAPINSNRLTGMQVLSSTNLSLAPVLWTSLTNNLTLTNGTVRVTNVNGASSSNGFFRVGETE